MKTLIFTGAVVLGVLAQAALSPSASAQCCQEYRLEYQTVQEARKVTAYRVDYETVYDEREVVTQRPVWVTETRQRRYTVEKPVYETSEREERRTVMKPVWETQVRDASYDRVTYVQETHEREERYVVNRPVTETETREERYTVMRPVWETAEREEQYTVTEAVTAYRPVTVDRGGWGCQTVYHPGPVRRRLQCQQGGCVTDPATGVTTYMKPGLVWVPYQCPGRTEVQRVWQPNVVTEQVPYTQYVPRVVTRKVPVQTCRYVPQEVINQVPVQVCKVVQEEQVRKIPYVVTKPVVEHIENKISEQVCRYVAQEEVYKVPVVSCKMTYEERVEDVPVQVCHYQEVKNLVRTPRLVEKRTPVTYTYYTPRTIVHKVPIDPCGRPIINYRIQAAPRVQASPRVGPVDDYAGDQDEIPADGRANPKTKSVLPKTNKPSLEERNRPTGESNKPAEKPAPKASPKPTEAPPEDDTQAEAPDGGPGPLGDDPLIRREFRGKRVQGPAPAADLDPAVR